MNELKLSYTARQLEPIEVRRRGAPSGNKNAQKPESQKAQKVQGYITPRQLQVLNELEVKMKAFCKKKKLRSYVIGTAIEILSLMIETVPQIILGDDEPMNQFLVAQNKNTWIVIDMGTGIEYKIYPHPEGNPENTIIFAVSSPLNQAQSLCEGETAVQFASQLSQMVMGKMNNKVGHAFKLAVDTMITPDQ